MDETLKIDIVLYFCFVICLFSFPWRLMSRCYFLIVHISSLINQFLLSFAYFKLVFNEISNIINDNNDFVSLYREEFILKQDKKFDKDQRNNKMPKQLVALT